MVLAFAAVILAVCLYVFHLTIKYVLSIKSISNSENKSNLLRFSLGDFMTQFLPGEAKLLTHPDTMDGSHAFLLC